MRPVLFVPYRLRAPACELSLLDAANRQSVAAAVVVLGDDVAIAVEGRAPTGIGIAH